MHHLFSVCRERAILYRLFIRSVEATQADVEEDHRSIICAPNALFWDFRYISFRNQSASHSMRVTNWGTFDRPVTLGQVPYRAEVKRSRIWPRFSTAVAFEALSLRKGATSRSILLIGVVRHTHLWKALSQIVRCIGGWIIGMRRTHSQCDWHPLTLKYKMADCGQIFQFLNRYNSAANCPIALNVLCRCTTVTRRLRKCWICRLLHMTRPRMAPGRAAFKLQCIAVAIFSSSYFLDIVCVDNRQTSQPNIAHKIQEWLVMSVYLTCTWNTHNIIARSVTTQRVNCSPGPTLPVCCYELGSVTDKICWFDNLSSHE